jgi:uncharacterized BrkB/YihY/UPF0761 family membrane protein
MVRRAWFAAFGLALSLWTRAALACPTCSDNLANDVYGQSPTALGRGFFWSIILMASLPFAVFSIVFIRILVARKKRGESHSGELAGSPEST